MTMESPAPEAARTGSEASWRRSFDAEEIASLLRVSDARGLLSLACNWGLITAALASVAIAPHPVTAIVALVVIGGRQLGLAVLMHEAAHRTLLGSRTWNDRLGSWLCAYPIWSDLFAYRSYHMKHHAKTWTDEDPDLGLATPFPVTPASLRRKIGRDLTGRTGIKFARASWRRTFGPARRGDPEARRAAAGVALTNLALLGVLSAAGHGALYLLWVGAWLTVYPLVTRIRSISEHAMVPDPGDPLRNTRTTRVRWWERLVLAPCRVNYHLEHHLLMTVPHYRLPDFHRRLGERGLLDRACIAEGYLDVLRQAASGTGGTPRAARVAPRVPPF